MIFDGKQIQYAFANIAASTTDGALVSAVSGDQIYVLAAFIVAGGTATDVTFNSKPSGSGAAVSAKIATGANGGAVLPLNEVGWFRTVLSEGLTVTTGTGSTVGVHVVYVSA